MFKSLTQLFITIVVAFTVNTVSATVSYIDSLQKNATSNKGTIKQLSAYNELAFYYNITQNNVSNQYSTKAIQLAEQLKEQKQRCVATVWQAVYNARTRQYSLAIKQFQQALNIANTIKDENLMGFVTSWTGYYYLQTKDYYTALIYFKDAYFFMDSSNINYRGYNYWLQGTAELARNNTPNALKAFNNATDVASHSKDNVLRFLCNNGLANTLVTIKDYKQALPQINKSVTLASNLNERVFIDDALNNKAIFYMLQNNYGNAIEVFDVIIGNTSITKNYKLKASSCDNCANAHFKLNDYAKALALADTAVKYAQIILNKEQVTRALLTKASILKALNNFPKAYECVTQAMIYAGAAQNIELTYRAVSLSSKLMYNQGNYKGAFEMQAKANQLNDSLYNETRIEDAAKASAEVKFEQRLRADSIRRLELDTEKNKQQAAKDKSVQTTLTTQRIIIIIAFIAALLVAAMAYNWRKNLMRVKKLNNLLEVQKEEIEIRREKLQLQNSKITAQRNAIEIKNKEITDSITYAKRIQNALLTSENFIAAQVKSHAIFYQPKDIVSGDFYWAERVGDKFIIATADCTGHGVPGAFMSLLGISFLNEIIVDKRITRPNDVLDTLRDSIIKALSHDNNNETYRDGMDMSLFSLDTKTNVLELASANSDVYVFRPSGGKALLINGKNVMPIKISTVGALYCIKSDKYPVGIHLDEIAPFTLNKIQLANNDVLFTGSDGYADQFGGPKLKKFKYNQLEELLMEIAIIEDSTTQKEILTTRFNNWKGPQEQVDDVLVMVVRI
jgi:tetratricopeptide (TPR) repeat protein